MNRQVNYVISAFLLFLLVFGIIFTIQNITIISRSPSSNLIQPESSPKPVPINPLLARGKTLFLSKCSSCHNIFKEGAYPALADFEQRGPWSDKKNIYNWVRNPSAFLEKNEYVRGLRKKFGSTMTAFPDLMNEEIDAIIEYIRFQNMQTAMPVTMNY